MKIHCTGTALRKVKNWKKAPQTKNIFIFQFKINAQIFLRLKLESHLEQTYLRQLTCTI